MRNTGTLICLTSALAFGTMGVFGKLAYEAGATVGTLLVIRFVVAAPLFWLIVPRRAWRALTRRDVLTGLALGAVGYALQAALYFAGLARLDAGLLVLTVYTFPAMVAGAAILLGRERYEPRKAGALVVALAGLALVVGGAGTGAVDPVGVGLALACAVVYTVYVLTSASVTTDPLPLSALVTTGAAVALTLGSLAAGDLHLDRLSAAGWGWGVAIAVIASVAAISLHLIGLRRVGPTTSSILATAEPLITVVLAFAVFGDTMNGAQLFGAGLVVGAVVLLNLRRPVAAAA